MNNTGALPTVSIIMATYNRAQLTVETVSNILQQTYTNWELIIIDDGSEDNTRELISAFTDGRIKFHEAGRIGIGGKIKNIGLEKATGSLIAFIDSDDLWASVKLERQVAALQQYPNAGFCLTSGYNFSKINEPVNYFYKKSEGTRCDNIFVSCFTSEVAAYTQTLMLRKECLPVAGRFKEEKSFSDVEFIYNLAFHFKAVILYEPLVYRRLHDLNYTTPNWEKSYYEGIAIIKSYADKLPRKVSANALFRAHINFGQKCLIYKRRGKAIRYFLTAWGYDPFSIIPVRKIMKSIFYYLIGK